jgi:hypothetical protein
MRARMRTYTAHSIGVGIAWAVLLVLASSARRGPRPRPGRPGHPVITCRIGSILRVFPVQTRRGYGDDPRSDS